MLGPPEMSGAQDLIIVAECEYDCMLLITSIVDCMMTIMMFELFYQRH